jgi:hypothetical protein
MVKTKKRKAKHIATELDSVYLLKIVLYVIVGSQWVWLVPRSGGNQIPLPIGLVAGVLFARHDHFQLDRKIEYALLLLAALIGFWSQVGVYVTI